MLIARILADAYNFRVYHVDEAFEDHWKHIVYAEHLMLHKWTNTPWNALWMQPVDVLVEEAIICYQEHFEMIVDDLHSLPRSEPILVKGTALLPNRAAELLTFRKQAIRVVPTEVFQRMFSPKRGAWVEEVLSECESPVAAFQNGMDRDVRFGKGVIKETSRVGLRLLEVDGQCTITENAEMVAEYFGLS